MAVMMGAAYSWRPVDPPAVEDFLEVFYVKVEVWIAGSTRGVVARDL